MANERFFEGKHAYIIGGSGGIGRYISHALARCGAELTVTGGSASHLVRLQQEIAPLGGTLNNILLPHETNSVIEAAITGCPQKTGILICAMGPFLRKPLAETTAEEWHRLVTLNLTLPGALVSACLGAMIQRHWGRILLFGGTNTETIRGWMTTAPYSAAKTALGALAKSVAQNAAAHGVTCNVVCPGLTDTEYLDDSSRGYNQTRSPLGKPLSAQEIADFAMYILKNPNLNGAILAIDQGIDIHPVDYTL